MAPAKPNVLSSGLLQVGVIGLLPRRPKTFRSNFPGVEVELLEASYIELKAGVMPGVIFFANILGDMHSRFSPGAGYIHFWCDRSGPL